MKEGRKSNVEALFRAFVRDSLLHSADSLLLLVIVVLPT